MFFEYQKVNFNEKNGSTFLYLVNVRAEGPDPPLTTKNRVLGPKITIFFPLPLNNFFLPIQISGIWGYPPPLKEKIRYVVFPKGGPPRIISGGRVA